MNILVSRYKHEVDFTIGKLFVNNKFECFTLEDESRNKKVMHETRIPEGTYKIELRTFGGHHEKYKVKFPFHKGMLWVKDVPNFKDILIHIGNTDEDTSGCLLLGTQVDERKGRLIQSTVAYISLYQKVLAAIESGEEVTIKYEAI